jgi:hypothetical protein
MPSWSAESVSSPSAVGSRLLRVELAGASAARAARSVLVDHLDSDDDRVGGHLGHVEIGVVVPIGGRDRDGAGTRGTTAGWPGAGELDLGERPRSEAQQLSRDPVSPRHTPS